MTSQAASGEDALRINDPILNRTTMQSSDKL